MARPSKHLHFNTRKRPNLVTDERGANLVEYIVLVGVIALVALGAFRLFGIEVGKTVKDQADTIGGINSTGPKTK